MHNTMFTRHVNQPDDILLKNDHMKFGCQLTQLTYLASVVRSQASGETLSMFPHTCCPGSPNSVKESVLVDCCGSHPGMGVVYP